MARIPWPGTGNRFFGDQNERLTRKKWRPEELNKFAEELSSFPGLTGEFEIDGPITIKMSQPVPPIQVIYSDDPDNPRPIEPPAPPPYGVPPTTTPPVTPPVTPAGRQLQSGNFYGEIQGGGPQDYSVLAFRNGPHQAPTGSLNVPQMHFHPDFVMPPGVPVVVYFNESGDPNDPFTDYWMLAPTWMPPP